MKRILFVEDDLMIIRIYRREFQTEGYEVDVAMDGPGALEAVKKNVPNLVVLDLQLPKLNGVEVLRQFRSRPDMQATPIIVFSNAFMGQLVEDAWKAGATKCLAKAHCTPKQLIEIMHGVLGTSGMRLGFVVSNEPNYAERIPAPDSLKIPDREAKARTASVSPTVLPSVEIAKPLVMEARLEPATSQPKVDVSAGDVLPRATLPTGGGSHTMVIRRMFIDSFPHTLTALRAQLMDVTRPGDEVARRQGLVELYRTVHSVMGNAGLAGLKRIAQLASALEAMVQELYDSPRYVNSSSLRTLATAVDGLAAIFQTAADPLNDSLPPSMALVVDDDPVCCRAACGALDRAGIKSVMIEQPEIGLCLGQRNRFDLIFLDVEMPGMSGFELASQLRAQPANAGTPIVFVSGLSDLTHGGVRCFMGAATSLRSPT